MKLLKNLPALLLVAVLGACGGPPVEARIALAETAHAVNATDAALVLAVRDHALFLHEALREMIEGGRLVSREAGLAWYDRGMEPYEEAVTALEVVSDSLRAVEAGLDAWEAGASGDGFLAAAACSGSAVLRLIGALARAGVEVPPELGDWLGFIDNFVTALCPEPAE